MDKFDDQIEPHVVVGDLAASTAIERVTTHYTPAGHLRSVDREIVATFDREDDAWASLVVDLDAARVKFGRNYSTTYEIKQGEQRIWLIDYYARTIGMETFRAQEIEPGFSINLDTWVRDLIAARAAAPMVSA